MTDNAPKTNTIEVSDELYQAIQQLKWVLNQITWQTIQSDEEVVWILVSWFIESLMASQWQWEQQNVDNWTEQNGWIIV